MLLPAFSSHSTLALAAIAVPALLLALAATPANAGPAPAAAAASNPEAVDEVINFIDGGAADDDGAGVSAGHERFARASPLRWGKRASNQVLRWGKREPLRWGKRSIGEQGHTRTLREAPLRWGKRSTDMDMMMVEDGGPIVRTLREASPLRWGKRYAQAQDKRAPLRWGKRAPSRFGKRAPSRFGKRYMDLDEQDLMDEIEEI